MARPYVGNVPNIRRILARRITGKLAAVRSFEVLLVRIFRWYPHWVEIESVVVSREPQDRLVAARKALLTMQAMAKSPDDPIPKSEPVIFEEIVQHHVERKDLTIIHMITDLPANRAFRAEQAQRLGNRGRLRFYIGFQRRALLVGFPNVVGWRGDDHVHALCRQ